MKRQREMALKQKREGKQERRKLRKTEAGQEKTGDELDLEQDPSEQASSAGGTTEEGSSKSPVEVVTSASATS
jgi:hypothetical protein